MSRNIKQTKPFSMILSIPKYVLCLIWWTILAITVYLFLYETSISGYESVEEVSLLNKRNALIVLLGYITIPTLIATLYRINRKRTNYTVIPEQCDVMKYKVPLEEFAQKNGNLRVETYENGKLKCIFQKRIEVECTDTLPSITAEGIITNKQNLGIVQKADGKLTLVSHTEVNDQSFIPLVEFAKQSGKMSLCRYANIRGEFGLKCIFCKEIEVYVDEALSADDITECQSGLFVSLYDNGKYFLTRMN